MSTDALCKLASALQMFLAEKEYETRTQERIAALEQTGLNFSADELEVSNG
jgi:hypothetical protein